MSRICVKALPRHMTQERLNEVFSSVGDVTDVKLLKKNGQKRNMGFVGFRSEADALAAVKGLHGTFIDTSRIVVEMAVPVGAPELQRPWSKHSKGSSAYTAAHPEEKKKPASANNNNKPQETNANGKRKVDKNDPQLLEFLGLHQKVKKWENDDTMAENRDNKDEDDNKSKKRKTSEKETEKVTTKKAKTEKVSDKVEKVEPIKNKSKKSTEATPEAVNKIVTKDEIHEDKVLQDEFGESDDEYEDLPDPTKQPLFLGEDEVEADGEEGNADVPMEDGEEDDFDYIKSKMGQSKKVNEEKDESSSGDDSEESEEEEKPKKKKHSENGGKVSEADTGRLFVRNLPFTITEEEIRELFGKYGIISDVHVPVDKVSNRPKGLALVQFMVPSDASKAMRSLDSKSFQGRLLHVIPGEEQRNVEAMKKDVPIDEKGASSYKAKQMKEQKAKSTTAYNWNSLYIRSDAVVEAFCARNGVTKSEIYDPTQPHLAVQLALMETQTIMETKQYLERNGVNIDVLSSSVDKAVKRSNNVILIKNIPYESTSNELTTQFQKHGAVARVIVPPSRTVALIEFVNPNEAKSAFKGLAYRKYHGVPLYLEWAPATVFDTPTPQALPTAPARSLYPSARPSTPPPSTPSTPAPRAAPSIPAPTAPSTSASASPATTPSTSTTTRIPAPSKPATTPSKPATPVPSVPPSQPAASEEVKAATLYVTNISFKTEDKDLISLFNKEEGYKNINIPKKLDKRGQPTLSSGNAFVNFETAQQAAKAREKLQGCAVDGFRLKIEFSMAKKEEARIPSTISAKMQPTTSAATLPGQSDAQGPTKLVVRNIPFEATQNELKALFQAVGGFKNARLPQKMDHKHRGFGFIEFLTHNEAKKALETMSNTHLYGRHLVLEFAKADRNLDEIRKKTAVDYARLTKAEGKEQPKWYEV